MVMVELENEQVAAKVEMPMGALERGLVEVDHKDYVEEKASHSGVKLDVISELMVGLQRSLPSTSMEAPLSSWSQQGVGCIDLILVSMVLTPERQEAA
jgi:hypothetical protein